MCKKFKKFSKNLVCKLRQVNKNKTSRPKIGPKFYK